MPLETASRFNAPTMVQATSSGLTVATTNYTSGDQLGALLQFDIGHPRFELRNAILIDKAGVLGGGTVDMLLFDRSVTPAADNAANAFSDADMEGLLYVVQFTTIVSTANQAIIQWINTSVHKAFELRGKVAYGALVTRSANNFFGAVGDVIVRLGVVPKP
jgi:hypothetical protein